MSAPTFTVEPTNSGFWPCKVMLGSIEILRGHRKQCAEAVEVLNADVGPRIAASAAVVEAGQRFLKAQREWEDARFFPDPAASLDMKRIASAYEAATMEWMGALANYERALS